MTRWRFAAVVVVAVCASSCAAPAPEEVTSGGATRRSPRAKENAIASSPPAVSVGLAAQDADVPGAEMSAPPPAAPMAEAPPAAGAAQPGSAASARAVSGAAVSVVPAHSCVTPGDSLSVRVSATPRASFALAVGFADHQAHGLMSFAEADGEGVYEWTFVVPPDAPSGEAVVLAAARDAEGRDTSGTAPFSVVTGGCS